MPKLSRRRRNWLELITSPGAKPQASARSDHRFIRLTSASGESCQTLMTIIVTRILSSRYVWGRPPGPAGSEGGHPFAQVTISRANFLNCNSLIICVEKMNGSSPVATVMAFCCQMANPIGNMSTAPMCSVVWAKTILPNT